MKIWHTRPLPPDPPPRDQAGALHISPLLLDLLLRRGMNTPEEMNAFLSPGLRRLAPPAEWPGIPQAARLLADKLLEGHKPAVWGDYDADGVTATALVLDVLEAHGLEAVAHLPDRRGEGYGLNVPALERLAEQGIRILLTVDCGIADLLPVARARELGMTVIISDHHLPGRELPDAHAICNPRLADCPCPHLAGVGVAFFLMSAVNSLLEKRTGSRFDMREVLDLVALGTLADVVRLRGQNRILVKNGLLKIAQAARPGMAAIKNVCGMHPAAALSCDQVLFKLAPRINAPGRMGEAYPALNLLRGKTRDEAYALAELLDHMNSRRREEEERIYAEAGEQAGRYADAMGLVLYRADWHPGVIGIVASRVAEDCRRPVLMLCDDADGLKGSGRSIPEFDLHEALSGLGTLLTAFGGHKAAAGLRLERGGLENLREAFDAAARRRLGDTPPAPALVLDGELGFDAAADPGFLRELELLQPFGIGNPEPVFASPALDILERDAFGPRKNHVRLKVRDPDCGVSLHAKIWRQAEALPASARGKRIRLAYTPRLDSWNGASSVDVRVRDWKFE